MSIGWKVAVHHGEARFSGILVQGAADEQDGRPRVCRMEVLGEKIQKLRQSNRFLEFEMSIGRRGVFLGKELLQLSNRAGELIRSGFRTMKRACFRQSDVRYRFQLKGVINRKGTVQRNVFDQEADDAAINIVLYGFIKEGRDADDERLWGRRRFLTFGAIRREQTQREHEQDNYLYESASQKYHRSAPVLGRSKP